MLWRQTSAVNIRMIGTEHRELFRRLYIDPIAFFRELAHLAATKFSDIALRRVVLNDPKSFDRNLSWPQIIGLSMPPPMAYASHEDESLHRQVRLDCLPCGSLGLRPPTHCTTSAVACIRIQRAGTRERVRVDFRAR